MLPGLLVNSSVVFNNQKGRNKQASTVTKNISHLLGFYFCFIMKRILKLDIESYTQEIKEFSNIKGS